MVDISAHTEDISVWAVFYAKEIQMYLFLFCLLYDYLEHYAVKGQKCSEP